MRVCAGGRRTATGIVLISVLALAGCGVGGGGAAPSPSPSGMTDAQLQVLVNNLVQCIREHGAPGMPDVPVRNGHVVVPDKNSVDQATMANVDSARQACKAVEDRIPAAALNDGSGQQGQSGAPTAADVPKLREFAKCMRANGVPDWPDPSADGSFRGPAPAAIQQKSPQLRTAMDACGKFWNGPIRFKK